MNKTVYESMVLERAIAEGDTATIKKFAGKKYLNLTNEQLADKIKKYTNSNKQEEREGIWRTIMGRRIFIAEGQDLEDALTAAGVVKVTEKILDSNPVQFISYYEGTDEYGLKSLQRATYDFDNVSALFNSIEKEYGGFKQFNQYAIMSNYNGGEYYLIRNKWAKGGWSWKDQNDDYVDYQSRKVGKSN